MLTYFPHNNLKPYPEWINQKEHEQIIKFTHFWFDILPQSFFNVIFIFLFTVPLIFLPYLLPLSN